MPFEQIIRENPSVISYIISASNNRTLVDIKEHSFYPLVEWYKKDILNNDLRFKYSKYIGSNIFNNTRTGYNQKEQYIMQERTENIIGKEFSLRLINLSEIIGKQLFRKLSISDKILMSKTFGVIDLGPNIKITSIYKTIDG